MTTSAALPPNPVLRDILATATTTDLAGQIRQIPDSISAEEARIIARLIRQVDARTTLETGTAYGVSALTICAALDSLPPTDPPRRHYGADPNQMGDYGGAALATLDRAGLRDRFTLLEGPAHAVLPPLLAEGVRLDFAFIDGWHTFDYKLLDFFYIDKMLRPGGIVALHDYQWESTGHVVRFALTHRRYTFAPAHRRLLHLPSPARRVGRVAKALLTRAGRTPLRSGWAALWGRPTMAILTKQAQYEPNYDFFAPF
jgi:predicted O-methyltransferase YrrM